MYEHKYLHYLQSSIIILSIISISKEQRPQYKIENSRKGKLFKDKEMKLNEQQLKRYAPCHCDYK